MNHYFLTAILYRNLSAFDIERIRNDGCMEIKFLFLSINLAKKKSTVSLYWIINVCVSVRSIEAVYWSSYGKIFPRLVNDGSHPCHHPLLLSQVISETFIWNQFVSVTQSCVVLILLSSWLQAPLYTDSPTSDGA